MQKRQSFDIALRELRTKLLKMGADVQEALTKSVQSLEKLDSIAAHEIVKGDQNINRQEHEIEDLCIRLIARQQPVATDLRKIVAGVRIASDLERMADLAVDVAKTTIRLQGLTLPQSLKDIHHMATIIEGMIADSLEAYVENSAQLAHRLAEQDDAVDHIYRKLVEGLFSLSAENPNVVSQAMALAFVGRYLERIGDHATNIGESVIYIASGERSDLN